MKIMMNLVVIKILVMAVTLVFADDGNLHLCHNYGVVFQKMSVL
jgi:hypothetical protein